MSASVRDLMRQSARIYARKPAVVASDRVLTYEEQWTRGLRLAQGLLAMGLEVGDRVGVLEGNTIEAVDFIAATTAAGLVRVPLYAGSDAATHAAMLRRTQCRVVVVDPRWRDAVPSLAEAVGGADRVIVRDDRYELWLAQFEPTDPNPRIDVDHPHVIRHTGGTTGQPKGVPYSHRMWLAACRDWFYGFPPIEEGDACLQVAPIAHGAAYFFTPVWLAGGVNVLLDGFDAAHAVDLLKRERIAYVFVVPPMLDAMARVAAGSPQAFSRLKVVAVAGAPLTDATIHMAAAAFGPVIYHVYGQTEAVPATLARARDWLNGASSRQRSAGRAFPFSMVEIRDSSNVPVSAGVVGQIAIRTTGQMEGYWDDPAATRCTLVDGWVMSGDAGYLDDEGFLYVLDRLGDAIQTPAGVVWPSQIENAVTALDGVQEAAALAIEVVGGEPGLMVAYVPAAEAQVSLEDVRDAVEAAAGVRPVRIVSRREPLPKTSVGKLDRRALLRYASD